MFENVDGRTTDGRTDDGRTTDAGVIGILIAHLGAFGSGELKIVSEYDQEIPQSQTADIPVASRLRAITRHQEDKSKATSSLLPIKMVAIPEWTQSNAQKNTEQLQTPTMRATINKKSTTTEPPPQNGQQPKPLGGLNALHWHQIFALDSAVVEIQEMFSPHGDHPTNTMYHHGETL